MNMRGGGLRDECWVISDGTAGMESQGVGLAARLPFATRVFRIKLHWPWNLSAPYVTGSAIARAQSGAEEMVAPWPRVVIGCGRQSIPFVRTIKRESGGATFTVQCQHPRIPPSAFDLVIPPMHDELAGLNVFPIIGSPNKITAELLARARTQFAAKLSGLKAPRVAVLLGGHSKTHGSLTVSEAARLGAQLAALATTHGLMIVTSRRTDPQVAGAVFAPLKDSDAFIWRGDGENPYLGVLAWADAFIVTSDSVNMVCEAAATGRPVHLVMAPGGRERARRFLESVAARGITRPFRGKIEQWNYDPLDETGRAAAHIRALLDVSASAPDIR